jgi:hypothetical protein
VSEVKAPAGWVHPLLIGVVAAVVGLAWADGRGREVYGAAAGVGALYVALDRGLRRALQDELAAKRALQIGSALVLSATTTAGLLDLARQPDPLTAWSPALQASLSVELGVTAASLLTAVRAQLAMPLLLLHHVLLLLACDYVTRHRFGTGVILVTLFQETTNVGWYLHWILNSPETRYHERFPRLFNLNALGTIGWYALGRFGVVTPLLGYFLWLTPAGAPLLYLALFVLGLAAQTLMNAQNLVKLARSYPRCTSSWLHRPAPGPLSP